MWNSEQNVKNQAKAHSMQLNVCPGLQCALYQVFINILQQKVRKSPKSTVLISGYVLRCLDLLLSLCTCHVPNRSTSTALSGTGSEFQSTELTQPTAPGDPRPTACPFPLGKRAWLVCPCQAALCILFSVSQTPASHVWDFPLSPSFQLPSSSGRKWWSCGWFSELPNSKPQLRITNVRGTAKTAPPLCTGPGPPEWSASWHIE